MPEYFRPASSLEVSSDSFILLKDAHVLEVSLEKLERITEVSVLGVFLCFKLAAIQKIKQGRGGGLIGIPGTVFIRSCSTSAQNNNRKER